MGLPIHDPNMPDTHFNVQHNQLPSPKVTLESQELIGNNKEFRISTNYINLKIIGNNNRIFIRKNKGAIQIVGNYVKIKIIKNYASIKCVGNYGRIYMGKTSPNTDFQYTGRSGKLKLVAEELFDEKHFPMSAPRTQKPNHSEKSNEESDDYRCTKQPHHHNNVGDGKRCESRRQSITGESMTVNQKLGKLHISLPNLSLTFETSTKGKSDKIANSLKISGSTGNININSFCHVT